jgi:hypothetical protein
MSRVLAVVPIVAAIAMSAFAQPSVAPGQPLASSGSVPLDTSGAMVTAPPGFGAMEEDVGLPGFAPQACQPVFSDESAQVGAPTGDLEKDNIGHVVVAETCN